MEALSPDQVHLLAYDVLTDAQIAEYEAQGELNFMYPLLRRGRFQVQFSRTPAGLAASFQRI